MGNYSAAVEKHELASPVQERRPLWPLSNVPLFFGWILLTRPLYLLISSSSWRYPCKSLMVLHFCHCHHMTVLWFLIHINWIPFICDTYSELQYHIIVSSFYKRLYHELFFTPSSESEPILGKHLPQVLAPSTLVSQSLPWFFAPFLPIKGFTMIFAFANKATSSLGPDFERRQPTSVCQISKYFC